MWEYHDTKIKELKALYSRISKQTQKRLQEIFNSLKIDFDNLYSIADNNTKKMINTQIEEWEDSGLLNDTFGDKAKEIKRRSKVKNNEILELLIWGAYIEEQNKIQDKELNILREDANFYYQEGQKEVITAQKKKTKPHPLTEDLFLMFMAMPLIRGYNWNEYVQSAIEYNKEQIYRQAVIDMQQLKDINIQSDIYQGIIKKQQNAKLNTNGDKISGAVDNAVIGLNNKSKQEGMLQFDSKAKVRFVAVEDNKTTPMCHSLDGQIFNVHDWNEFERYSDTNKGITKYKCYGLIQGLNLPPIDDHFHYCRSGITYIIDKQQYKHLNSKYEDITKQYSKTRKYNLTKQNYFIDKNGNKYDVDNKSVKFKISDKEKEIAKLIGKTFGGNVYHIPVVLNPQKIKTPDYLINGESYDLKEIFGNEDTTLYNALSGKREQADNFIFDISNTELSFEDVANQVNDIYTSSRRYWVRDIVITKNNEVIKIYRRQ